LHKILEAADYLNTKIVRLVQHYEEKEEDPFIMCLEELYYGTKYIPLAIDVSDQNVFLSNYNFLQTRDLLGKGSVFCMATFLHLLFMFGVKI